MLKIKYVIRMKRNLNGISVFLILAVTLVHILSEADSASTIDVTKKCFGESKDTQRFKTVPECQVHVDLVERQRCVDDLGFFLILDEQARQAVITCQSSSPIDIDILPKSGSFLEYELEEYVVIHERETKKNSSIIHTVRVPLILPTDNRQVKTLRKYIFRNRDFENSSRVSDGIQFLVATGGTGVIFSVGKQKPRLTSNITYIPCLYDFTNGIRKQDLSAEDESGKTYEFDLPFQSHNPLLGFQVNVTTTPLFYREFGKRGITCEGESPSVNPNLPGAAVAFGGFGVQFHAGILAEPMLKVLECYTKLCTLSCEYTEPIVMTVTHGQAKDLNVINGKLLFKTYENVTRYQVKYSGEQSMLSMLGEKSTVRCKRKRDNEDLHEWIILYADILNPVPGQSLMLKIPKVKAGSSHSRVLECLTLDESSSISSFFVLPCNNDAECHHYMKCVKDKAGVQRWKDGYTVPKYCSPPVSSTISCSKESGDKDKTCEQIELTATSGVVTCMSTNMKSFESNFIIGFDGKLYVNLEAKNLPSNSVVKLSIEGKGEIYSKASFSFKCESHHFYTEHGLQWKLKWRNGSVTIPSISDDYDVGSTATSSAINPLRRSKLVIESSEIVAVICLAPLIYSNDWIENELPLLIKETITPNINVPSNAYIEADSSKSLDCTADGDPLPTVQWIIPKEIQVQSQSENVLSTKSNGLTATLTFPKFTETFAGDYYCWASNGVQNITKKVTIAIKGKDWTFVIVGTVLTILLIFLLMIFIMYKRWKNISDELQRISDAELDEFLNGISGSVNAEDYRFVLPALTLPYNTAYEIDIKKLEIDKETYLGSGQFGVVYKANLTKDSATTCIPVAVKTLKSNCSSDDLKNLLSEIKLMIYLEKHSNLVEFLGAVTKNCKKGEVYVALEFCNLGSLKSYLEKNREVQEDEGYTNVSDLSSPLEISKLCQWSYEIACGMDYIASKNMIHGDLATRNVLLQSNGNREIAKISDFGLSRKLYEYTQYVKTKQEPLPWRWLAIETLRQMKFSTKSDVWAFGITLWEIFSLGDVPYPGLSYNIDFIRMLENGLRNSKPSHANDKIYKIMKQCWALSPDQRPSFSEIKTSIETELEPYIEVADNKNI